MRRTPKSHLPAKTSLPNKRACVLVSADVVSDSPAHGYGFHLGGRGVRFLAGLREVVE